MKARHQTVATMALALIALLAGLHALGRAQVQAQTPTPTPAVDLTGDWGGVYGIAGTTFGECTFVVIQTNGKLNSPTSVECESGGTPTGTGGVLTGTVSVTKLNFEVAFLGPGSPFTVNCSGSVAADGNTLQCNWGIKPAGIDPANTGVGSRLTATTGGSNVTVDVPDAGATVTFTDVTDAGGTTVLRDNSTSGTLPGQFEVVGEFYHVITTAAVVGDINVCVSYQDKDNDGIVDGTSPPIAETDLQLLHNEGGTYVDRTDTGKTDYVLNQICAVVPSLSEFALGAQAVPTPTPTPTATDTPEPTPTPTQVIVGGISLDPELGALPSETVGSSGADAGVLAGVIAAATAGIIALTGAAWYARRRWLA